MKALKKAVLGTTFTGALLVVALGSYNSMVSNKNAFDKNEFGIKFTKRLDDIHGNIVAGRMAASIPKPSFAQPKVEAPKVVVEKKKEVKKQVVKTQEVKKKSVAETVAEVESPGPAIKKPLRGMTLVAGRYNKEAFKAGQGISGVATVDQGIVETIDVTFNDGKRLVINTNTEMVGNVFEYEDSETREFKSGVFYEVDRGTKDNPEVYYVFNITDDTNFENTKLEFRVEGDVKIATNERPEDKASWAMNANNENPENVYRNNNDNVYADAQDQENYAMNMDEFQQQGVEDFQDGQDFDGGNGFDEGIAPGDEENFSHQF